MILPRTRTRTCPGWSNHTGVPHPSILGEVTIERTCSAIGQDRVEAAPLDGANCTCRNASIRTCSSSGWKPFVVDDAHAEAIRKLETILWLEITVRASEDSNRE